VTICKIRVAAYGTLAVNPNQSFTPLIYPKLGGAIVMEDQQTLCGSEVINKNLLVGLAIVAKTNNHSILEELNLALYSYVTEHLPEKVDDEHLASVALQDSQNY